MLSSNPYNGNEIIVCLRICCPQTGSSTTFIASYNNGKIWGLPDYCLSLKDVKDNNNLNQLTFMIEIRIIKILNHSIIIYQDPIYNKIEDKSFEWYIDNKLLEKNEEKSSWKTI